MSQDIKALVAYLVAPFSIEFKEILISSNPTPNQIICKTLYSAISPGTELSAYNGEPALRKGSIYPRLMGYCNVAEVISTGSNVYNLSVGDLIFTNQSHRSHFIAESSDFHVKIPKQNGIEKYTTSYLYHLAYNALLNTDVRLGTRVGVIGMGAIGLCVAELASNNGAIVTVMSNYLKSSGNEKYNVLKKDVNFISKNSFDTVITTSNDWDDWLLALTVADQRACIGVLGFPGRTDSSPKRNPLASEFFYDKQLTIKALGVSPGEPDPQGFNRYNLRSNMEYLVQQISLNKLNPARLISTSFKAFCIDSAYKALCSRKNGEVTILLEW